MHSLNSSSHIKVSILRQSQCQTTVIHLHQRHKLINPGYASQTMDVIMKMQPSPQSRGDSSPEWLFGIIRGLCAVQKASASEDTERFLSTCFTRIHQLFDARKTPVEPIAEALVLATQTLGYCHREMFEAFGDKLVERQVW